MEHVHERSWSRISKTLVAFVLAISIGSTALPQRAHAVLGFSVVVDPTNLVQNTVDAVSSAAIHVKEYVLDTLAWQVGNLAIQSMTKSLVNWINSGFKGSPAFVTDLNRNLQGVGDKVASEFFESLSSNLDGITTTPFQDKVIDAVRLGYYLRTSPESFYTKYPYTLNQVSSNDKEFLKGKFTEGGFNAWFQATLVPQNNPYGARELAEKVLSEQVGTQVQIRTRELDWGKGFLSWRGDCVATTRSVSAAADAMNVTGDEEPVDLSGEDECLGYEVKTPGSVIMEAIPNSMQANMNRLVSADELNEIVGALMNQLIGQVLGSGSGGGGLSGLSRPSAGGGASVLDQATDPSQAGSTQGISSTFAATLSNQRKYVAEYQAGWNTIRTAAQAVPQRCSTSGSPSPQDLIARSGEALVQAANGLAALDALQTRLTAALDAGGSQTTTLLAISEDYNELISSDTLPSAEAIAEAQTESKDSGESEQVSFYTQMTRLASSRTCDVSDE